MSKIDIPMSILIKQDIKSADKDGDWGFNGKKSPAQELTVEELMQKMSDENFTGLHEMLTGDRYRAYADLDCPMESEKEVKKNHYTILRKGHDYISERFPDCDTAFSTQFRQGRPALVRA